MSLVFISLKVGACAEANEKKNAFTSGAFRTLVALGLETDCEYETIRSSLDSFDPLLSSCELLLRAIPAGPAYDQDDWSRKAVLWPVSIVQRRPHVSEISWTARRRAWIKNGIKRVIAAAKESQERGELPVAAHTTCPPPDAIVGDPNVIQPTPNIRAEGFDTRISTGHPLRHAALGCVAEIAHLRTVPPFSATLAIRNGSDYLLTSLSLFITHEPCVMCTMALVHSRVKEVFYIVPSSGGGFGSAFKVHGYPGLNHRIDVYDCGELVKKEDLEALRLPEGINV